MLECLLAEMNAIQEKTGANLVEMKAQVSSLAFRIDVNP
jgi:hypothetical protein